MRFIPTCVGNIFQQVNYPQIAAVHPHVCGEHYATLIGVTVKAGSSPRVWGTSSSVPP